MTPFVASFRCVLLTLSFSAACFLGTPEGEGQGAEPLTYERDVRPILKANCFRCHGEGNELQGNLDLRLFRLLSQGGDSGTALVAGDAERSVLFQRVRDGEMPPPEVEKRLTPAEIDVIRHWIETGANRLRDEPADADPAHYLTEEERGFWSFQPVVRPVPPAVKDETRLRSAIDRLLLARLEQADLTFSEDASKTTLLRRVYFDLLGLPPSPDDCETFLADDSPDAYERLVDRLLSSPHYGERWGRHWLDAAGYADSEGYHDEDAVRPDAWKYRDYVIRAFNSDKPYDRFLIEQLAGDELIGRELRNLNPDETEWLVATGFLRMAPDGTGARGVDQNVARNEMLAKTIEIISTSLLGLTVGCAQCHDHRYDPISQKDYYALRAVFEPAFNWKDWRPPAQRRVSMYRDEDRRLAAEVEEQAKSIDTARNAKQSEFIQRTLEKELAKLAPELQQPVREARDTAAARRTPEQKRLLQQYPSVNVSAGSLYLYDGKAADELKRMAEEASQKRQQKPVEEFVRATSEPLGREPPVTFLFARGQFDQPKEQLEPKPLTVLSAVVPGDFPLDDPALPTTGRRLALARWLTDSRHPLTARVIVNRVWLHHFGRGLVESPGDFGYLGARPTHAQLLDWLASELMAEGWSLKRLHRELVTSTTYRQSAMRREDAESIDPENRLLARMSVRRHDAEALRDSLLAVSGQLNAKAGGPPVPVMADPVGQFVLGIENLSAGRPGAVIAMRGEEFRRSVYTQFRRSRPLSILEPFDFPRMEPNCNKRASSTVAPQALLMMNSEFLLETATALARRLRQEAGRDVLAQIRRAWDLVYSEDPTPAELAAAAQFVLDQATHFAALPPPATAPAPKPTASPPKSPPASPPPADPQLEAMASLCHALFSSNRFLYVD
jgi:mono/diheme cytochrome c family protein